MWITYEPLCTYNDNNSINIHIFKIHVYLVKSILYIKELNSLFLLNLSIP
jgi:hypothetical protein